MSAPSSRSSAGLFWAAAPQPRAGEALAWLRSDRSRPPAFLPGEQAAVALEAWAAGGVALEALEARCLAGDSSAARALSVIHAAAAAWAAAMPAAPAPGLPALRDRIVASAAARLGPIDDARAAPAPASTQPSVVAVGLRHRERPSEPARQDAIAALAADVRGGDPVLEQVLDRVAALVDFPLLVVSVVAGPETVHRAFRCTLPAAAPRVVPREASFCTHCVADDAPLVITDAASDPFFSRHPAVAAFGLVAYLGVPLRAAAPGGAPLCLGTLCGYDVRPRDPAIHDVALLEVFARRVAAHVEGRGDDAAVLDREASSREGVDLYAAPLFSDLVAIVADRAAAGRPATLLVGARGAPLVAGDARLVGGRLEDGRPAWLVASAGAPIVVALAAELGQRTGADVRAAPVADFAGPGAIG
jgi:hypothetical protein